jgi:transcriptional regulator with XRE-family HTH domain
MIQSDCERQGGIGVPPGDAVNSSPGPGPGLGERLRQVRADHGLSARELARRIGCSPSLISQIERGNNAPSAAILYMLANQLNVSLDYLFGLGAGDTIAQQPQRTSIPTQPGAPTSSAAEPLTATEPLLSPGPPHNIIQRGANRPVIELSSGARWERLTPQPDALVDFLELIYEPRVDGAPAQRFIQHEGREYLLVLNGPLHAEIGFGTYLLNSGDSAAFDAATPHRYHNASSNEVRCISVIVRDQSGNPSR